MKHVLVEGIQKIEGITELSSLTSSYSIDNNLSYRGPNEAVPVALES